MNSRIHHLAGTGPWLVSTLVALLVTACIDQAGRSRGGGSHSGIAALDGGLDDTPHSPAELEPLPVTYDNENDEQGPAIPCEGTYQLDSWIFDIAPFRLDIINSLLSSDLEEGNLVAALKLQEGPVVKWVDLVEDELFGGWVQDPDVTPSPPIPVRIDEGMGFRTTEEGALYLWISAPDYPDAQAMEWELLDVKITGRFSRDCSKLWGRLSGAFLDMPEFSIGAPSYDIDGDGVADGFWMESEYTARPLRP